MSLGAGRLERAVIEVMKFALGDGLSVTAICRRVYPAVTIIEKRHRVAVLQVLHRLRDNPPRPTEHRDWGVAPTYSLRGYWHQLPLYLHSRSIFPDPYSIQIKTAHHEAGHALADLYFGHEIECAVAHTIKQIHKQQSRTKKQKNNELDFGFVRLIPEHRWLTGFSSLEDAVKANPIRSQQELVSLLAGPIAEAHYEAKWPNRQRGVSQTYSAVYFQDGVETSDVEKANIIAGTLSDNLDEQVAMIRRAQHLAQALVRSEPGWRFIGLLAERLLDMKHGSLGYRRCAAVFREAFGRPPPTYREWDRYWPPTLTQFRTGWLPPKKSGTNYIVA